MSMLFNVDGSVTNRPHQVCFKHTGHGDRPASTLDLEGVPFMIVGSKFMECHQGPQRRRPKQTSTVYLTALLSCRYILP